MMTFTKLQPWRRTTEMHDEDMEAAFRRRMWAQALYDRMGKGVAPVVAYRFASAANWDRMTPPGIPGELIEVLKNDQHQRRHKLPPGPIMAAHLGRGLEIVEP